MTLHNRSWLLVAMFATVALLPFGRMTEMPLLCLSIFGVIAVARGIKTELAVPLLLLFISFWLPMLLSLPDAIATEKAGLTTLGALRYPLSCCALLWLAQSSSSLRYSQESLLKLFGMLVSVTLVLWSLDGLLQFFSGSNILGYGRGEGYVNGLFGDDDNVKFGQTVALLFPIGVCYLQALKRPWLAAAFTALCLLVVVLSGKRAAWIVFFMELLCLAVFFARSNALDLKRGLQLFIVLLIATFAAYASSDWVRERSDILVLAVSNPDYESLNQASGKRLPIWGTAVRMGKDNWVNGVGPRGFRYAYESYALEGDKWTRPSDAGGSKASHAHQLLLELCAETGVPGLMGYLAMVWLLLQLWSQADAIARRRALPFAVGIVGMMFPINTHPAWYSSFSASLLWFFIGLYLLALSDCKPEHSA